MTEHNVVGKSVENLDILEVVTGKAQYCADLQIPGMLYGKVLRSTRPHAKIISIDTSRAEKLPGVKCVIIGKDVPQHRFGEAICDKHVLTSDKVRYVGDPIAAVAAETTEIADEALDLIKVEYEDLPAIFDPEEAWSTNPSVIVHPDLPRYKLGPVAAAPDQRITLIPERPNVLRHYKIRHGDTKKGFKEADVIIKNRYSTARIQACTMEPHGCVAQVNSDGKVTVWSGRQLLYFSREHLCGVFGLPSSKVRLISSMHIGGSFGAKSMFSVEPIAIALAQKSGNPVKLTLTREEVFTCGGSRIPMVIYLKDGVKRDGTIVAREAKIILNAGAYGSLSTVLSSNLTYSFAATYRVPNMSIDAYAVYTNEPEAISFRGFASSQPIFAMETQLDIIAEKLGIDPIEIRRKNILKEGEENTQGELAHSIGARECLDKVAKEMGQLQKPSSVPPGWKVGRGIALGNKYCMSSGISIGWVKVHDDGTLEVRQGADNFGQGAPTVMAQIAADVFNMPTDRVHVNWGDTENIPFSTGTISQGSTYNVGKGVWMAAHDARRKVLERASKKMEVAVEAMDMKDGRVYVKTNHAQSIDFSALFIKMAFGSFVQDMGEIVGKATWIQQSAAPDHETGQIPKALAEKGLRRASFYGYAAQGVELMVNTETGQVEITRLVQSCDMGEPINPKLCEGQMEGGMVMSLGSTLLEQMVMVDGKNINANLHDYRIPGMCNVPNKENIKLFFTPVPHKEGPFGAKGMGETVMTAGAPAIGNAIYDAIGLRVMDIPITPEKILAALRSKDGKPERC